MPAVKVFFSYARKDYDTIAPLFGSFKSLLGSVSHKGQRYRMEYYWDQRTTPGELWNDNILWELKSADVVVFFITHNFLSSSYILDNEIPIALERRENVKIHLLPILIEECHYSLSPIKHLQFIPLHKGYLKPMREWKSKKAFWEYVLFSLKISVKNSLDRIPDPRSFNPNWSPADKKTHLELFANPETLKLAKAMKKRRKYAPKKKKETLAGKMKNALRKMWTR